MGRSTQKGLDALISPSALTLGKLAILERIESPLMSGNFNSLVDNLKAMYAMSLSVKDFYAQLESLEENAVIWGESLSLDEYKNRLTDLADGLVEFGILMPRPDEDAKKKDDSETAGS